MTWLMVLDVFWLLIIIGNVESCWHVYMGIHGTAPPHGQKQGDHSDQYKKLVFKYVFYLLSQNISTPKQLEM